MAQNLQCDEESLARIKQDIVDIVTTKIQLTDPASARQLKLFEIDMIINNILKDVANDRANAAIRLEAEATKLAALQMADEEINGQLRERAAFLRRIIVEINSLDDNQLTLTQIAQMAKQIEDMKIANAWDTNIIAFNTYNGISDQIRRDIFNYLYMNSKTLYQSGVQKYTFIKDNAYPMFCYLMTFICLLPVNCIDSLRGLLGEYAYLIDWAIAYCYFWQAQTAKNVYVAGTNVTPVQVEEALTTLFGAGRQVASAVGQGLNMGGDFVLKLNDGVVFLLLKSINTLTNLGSMTLSAALRGLSGRLDLANVDNISIEYLGYTTEQDQDNASVVTNDTVFTATSSTSSKDYTTASKEGTIKVIAVFNPNQRLTPPQELMDALAVRQVLGQSRKFGSSQEEVRNIDTGELISSQFDEDSQGDSQDAKKSRGDTSGGRKSRRYKKRRSTLKRRRMKRRRTRKGKKRRHTKRR